MDAVVEKVLDLVEKAVTCCIKKFISIKDFDKNLEALGANVKDLSDKAIDMKTEVENQERSGNKKRTKEVESWFNKVEKIEKELDELKEQVTRGKKNVRALKKMKRRVGELVEQSNNFGSIVHDVNENKECPLPVSEVHEETAKRNLELIWTWLSDENVSSIGIWGMGGVGKTTLAKHIHKRLVNDPRYQVRWVTVSHGFSIKGLQDQLANIVDLDISNEEDEERRAGLLNRAFRKRKNIVIILDDVWDRLCLEKLGDPLGVEGCRLILTTRKYEVCQKVGCQKLVKVEKLNTDDAWVLFKKNLGSETLLSPDIEPIAESLAGRCDGLPLGLITLARSMSGVTDIREWENALNEFPEDMESDVFKVLKYSYDRLRDTTMQECFLYCALYPEDWAIDRDDLIGRFIMEGLVKGDRRKEEFNKGHTILNKLVKLCLLEEAIDDDRELEAVKMHDLLREMALRITNDKPRWYMVRAGTGSQVPEKQDWAFDLDRVSFYHSNIKAIPEDVAPNCPTLSTLLLSWCSLRSIPGPFFQYMSNLQVLDLSDNSELMDLPRCISNLESLGALSLRGCSKLTSMPPLGKLKNLRVLDVCETGINELPQGIGNLFKLKFLDMGGTHTAGLPKEILTKLSQLQYLYLPLRMNVRVEDLASLELMEEFGGRFCNLHNFYKFMRNHRNYWGYDITVSESPYCVSDYSVMRRVKKRRVSFEDLTLEEDAGEAPTSIVLPNCIDILEIIGCHGLMSKCLVDNFLLRPTLRGLSCKIYKCDEIEWIVNVPSRGNTTPDPHCMCFRSLAVHSLRNLIGLCKEKIASHTFSGLTELHISYCPRMKLLFPRAILQDLKNLEKLRVNMCFEVEEIIGREEEGSSNPHITSTTCELPKLKELQLLELPKLKSICEGKLMCDSIEHMKFYKCPNVKRLPFYTPATNQHPFPSLETIRVDDESRWERLEWEQPNLKTLFQPNITYLHY